MFLSAERERERERKKKKKKKKKKKNQLLVNRLNEIRKKRRKQVYDIDGREIFP